jgi:hypothetical protein
VGEAGEATEQPRVDEARASMENVRETRPGKQICN